MLNSVLSPKQKIFPSQRHIQNQRYIVPKYEIEMNTQQTVPIGSDRTKRTETIFSVFDILVLPMRTEQNKPFQL